MKRLKYKMLTEEEKKTYHQLLAKAKRNEGPLSRAGSKVDEMFSWFQGGKFLFFFAKLSFEESRVRGYVKRLMRTNGCDEIDKTTFPDYPYTTFELMRKSR